MSFNLNVTIKKTLKRRYEICCKFTVVLHISAPIRTAKYCSRFTCDSLCLIVNINHLVYCMSSLVMQLMINIVLFCVDREADRIRRLTSYQSVRNFNSTRTQDIFLTGTTYGTLLVATQGYVNVLRLQSSTTFSSAYS